MNKFKEVNRYFYGKDGMDGAGVKLIRCFGYNDIPDYDPYIMMDFFDSTNPDDYIKGFPWHPHRGIETITYLVSGEIEHEDSLGNKGVIRGGDCQWMSAGSGILHQEMPQVSDRMLGVQIWLNLPKVEKMSEPRYRDITKDMIPVVEEDGVKVNIIAGKYKSESAKVDDFGLITKPMFFHIELEKNSEFIYEMDEDLSSYAFILEGEANFNQSSEEFVPARTGVLYEKGGIIRINTKDSKARIFLLGGRPLNEEVAWGGPIVMNTREELKIAFEELDNGTFIK